MLHINRYSPQFKTHIKLASKTPAETAETKLRAWPIGAAVNQHKKDMTVKSMSPENHPGNTTGRSTGVQSSIPPTSKSVKFTKFPMVNFTSSGVNGMGKTASTSPKTHNVTLDQMKDVINTDGSLNREGFLRLKQENPEGAERVLKSHMKRVTKMSSSMYENLENKIKQFKHDKIDKYSSLSPAEKEEIKGVAAAFTSVPFSVAGCALAGGKYNRFAPIPLAIGGLGGAYGLKKLCIDYPKALNLKNTQVGANT